MQRGFVEVIRPFQIRGWACDDSEPELAIKVRVTIDRELVVSGIADLFRDDLLKAGAGTGRHGFVLNLHSELSEAIKDRITVTGIGADGVEFLLTALPTAWQDGAATETRRSILDPQTLLEKGAPLSLFAEASEPAHHPVFILGSPRSGTSAVAQGLMASTRYLGQGEGHLFDIIDPVFKAIRTHYDNRGEEWAYRATMIAEVPMRHFNEGFQHLLIVIGRRLFPGGYWLDKTPGPAMIAASPLLRQVWPSARFIFMKRRGIENLQSRIRKFPTISFEAHCRAWAESMKAWDDVRSELKGCSIEIDQFTLATDTGMVVEALSSLLNLLPQETERLAAALKLDLPERTSESFGSATNLNEVGWSTSQLESFKKLCGEVMSIYGYSADESYFQTGKELEGILLN